MIRDGKFFRPERRGEETEEGRFHGILKKTVRVTVYLLLLSFFLFIGHRVYAHLLEDPLFRVREVGVAGCRKIAQDSLVSLAQIEGMPNLFTVRLKEIADRLESHPWIDYVSVRKVFPNKILIQVEERKPIAILQLEELYYIDAKGVIFSPVGDGDGYNYPFLTGMTPRDLRDSEEGNRLLMKGLELLLVAKREKLSPLEEISEIHMEKASGIQCFTKAEGLEVRMGWSYFGEKLKRLSVVWSDLQKRGVSAASIDCSDLKRMVVKKASKEGEPGRR